MFLLILITSLLSLMSLLMFQETKDLRIFFVPVAICIVQSLLLLKSLLESQLIKVSQTISEKSTKSFANEPKPTHSESLME